MKFKNNFFKMWLAIILVLSGIVCMYLKNDTNSDTPIQTVIADKSSTGKKVILGGFAFGVKLLSNGVMVIGISEVNTPNGVCSPAQECGLQKNDIILNIDNQKVKTNEQLHDKIVACDNSLNLTVKRNDDILSINLTPVSDSNGIKRAGIWVRDSAAGIGTATYIDPDTKTVAGLGHAICDSDTKQVIPLYDGEICIANITSVTKSVRGNIGGLNGYFDLNNLGKLVINNEFGVFATTKEDFDEQNLITVAEPCQVKTGKAKILTTIDENGPKLYDIEIETIDQKNKNPTKNMTVKITDDELLAKTGGIVQGMSGSPIIQNGMLIGAVTHVFVNAPQKGYGIFAENMLNNYNICINQG